MNFKTTRAKWILGLGLLALLGGGLTLRKFNDKNGKTNFTAYPVGRTSLELKVLTTGIVQPENRLEIKSPVAGRAEKILVIEGEKVKRGQILAWMSSTERSALLDAATSKGKEEREQWEKIYKPTPLLAPIDGMIILRNIEPGQTFTASDAVLVMSDRLTIKAQVDETDISKIQLKQSAEVILDAYPNEVLNAQVDQIAFDAKTVNNVTNYIVDVLPHQPPAFLRSGMTANVTFLIDKRENVLFVPAEAIKTLNGKSYVQIKKEANINSKVFDESAFREIHIGLTDGKKIEVVDGLNEGETIFIPEFKLPNANKSGSPFTPSRPKPKAGS